MTPAAATPFREPSAPRATFGPQPANYPTLFIVLGIVSSVFCLLSCVALSVVFVKVIAVLPNDPQQLAQSGLPFVPGLAEWLVTASLALLLSLVPVGALTIAAVFWTYRVWSWLPIEERWARNWKKPITPAEAAVCLLIPLFNLYWFFLIEGAICDAFDRLNGRLLPSGGGVPLPKFLVILAFLAMLLFPLPPFFVVPYVLFQRRVLRAMQLLEQATQATHATYANQATQP